MSSHSLLRSPINERTRAMFCKPRLLLPLMFCACATVLMAAEIHVSPTGSDTNPGTKDNPDAKYEFEKIEGTDKGYVFFTSKDAVYKTYVTDNGLIAGEGLAQLQMDALARANKTKTTWTVSKTFNHNKHTQAKSLLAEKSAHVAYNKYIKKAFDKLEKVLDDKGLIKPGYKFSYKNLITKDNKSLNDDQNLEMLEDILIKYTDETWESLDAIKIELSINTISLDTLKGIMTFDAEGNNNDIRLPLDIDVINELGTDILKNKGKLNDILATKLVDINPSRIQINTPDLVEAAPESKSTTAKNAAKIINKVLGSKKTATDDRLTKKEEDELDDLISGSRKRTMKKIKAKYLGKPISQVTARDLLAKYIPGIDTESEDVLQFVDEMVLEQLAGENVIGLYDNGVIYVKDKNGKTYLKIVKHEIGHKIFTEYLTPEEQDNLIDAYKKDHPQDSTKSDFDIEELIMQMWQDHEAGKLDKVDSLLMKFFNWLSRVFGFMNRNTSNLNRFFETIESGYFSQAKQDAVDIKKTMFDLVKKYGEETKGSLKNNVGKFKKALEIYLASKGNLQTIVANLKANGVYRDGANWPVTKDELRNEIIYEVNRKMNEKIIPMYIKYKDNKNISIEKKRDLAILKIAHEKILKNLDELLVDLYPTWKKGLAEIVGEEDEVEAEDLAEIEEKEEETVNLKQHIQPSDEVNHESKQSIVVKDFLSNINISESDFMAAKEAYIRTLILLEGIQVYVGKSAFEKQLSQALINGGNHVRSKVIHDELLSIMNSAYNNFYGKELRELPKNKKFLDENTFIAALDENTNLNYVKGTSAANLVGTMVITREKPETTQEFITRIHEVNPEISIEDIIGHFRKYEDVNKFNSIITYFNNQKQKNPYFMERIIEGGGVSSVSLRPGSHIGMQTNISGTLNTNITDKFKEPGSFAKWYRGRYLNHGLTITNKLDFIKWILREFNLGILTNKMPSLDEITIESNIKKFLERAITRVDVEKVTDDEGVIHTMDMAEYLKAEKRMVNSLAKPLSMSSAFIKATKIKSLNGKSKYLWSPTSFAHRLFYYFLNSSEYEKENVNRKIPLEMPEYLKTEYFKNNIFVNKFSKIHEVMDYDGLIVKSEWGIDKITTFENEDSREYLIREFIGGFLDVIDSSPENKITYAQFLYPNERASAIGLRVNLLNNAEIKKGVRMMVDQLISKKDITHLKNYKKSNLINARVFGKSLFNEDGKLKKIDPAKLTEKVMNQLWQDARVLAETIIEKQIPFDKNTFQISNLKAYISPSVLKSFNNDTFYGVAAAKNTNKEGEYNWTVEQILPIVELFYLNQYVNSYFANQLIVGDYSQYKNEEEVMKRFGMATAPKHVPVVDRLIGMEQFTRFTTISDPKLGSVGLEERLRVVLKTKEELDKLPGLLAGINIDSNDGNGFILPERVEELQNSLGNEFGLGNILKPQIFNINAQGETKGIKYSSVNLTDEFVEMFPSFEIFRNNMRALKVKEIVYNTGIKMGNEQTIIPYEQMFAAPLTEEQIADYEQSVFELDNNHYGIQLDPTAKIDSKVATPSQLVFLSGVLGQNVNKALDIYEHLSRLSDLGYFKFNTNYGSRSLLEDNVAKLLKGKNSKREHELISAGLSINFPALTDKIIIHLTSNLKDSIVKIKWPGTKLIQQSDQGIGKFSNVYGEGDYKLKSFLDDKGRLVHEVILPEGLLPELYEKQIKESIANKEKSPDYFTSPDLLGFRIPSSDIHSAVVMKVVGFYPTKSNVIIAPDTLVYVLGFDFDVDALFVIKRSEYKNQLVGYNDVHSTYGVIKKEFDFYQKEFDSVDQEIAYQKNYILEKLLDITSHPNNIPTMVTPIPLDIIRSQRDRIKKAKNITAENDLSNYNNRLKAHDVIFGSSKATGIFGNASKAIAYMLRTGPKKEFPKLKHSKEKDAVGFNIKVDGKIYDQLRLTDKKTKTEGLFVFMDGFINASIDNMKELSLFILNVNSHTISSLIAMKSIGMDFTTIINILQQPAVLEYSKTGSLDRVRSQILAKSKVENYSLDEVSITSEKINKSMEYNSLAEIENDDDLIFQLKMLDLIKQTKKIGDDIGTLGRFLSIAKEIPVTKSKIEEKIADGEKIFGQITDSLKLPWANATSFSFNVEGFFEKNKHLHNIYMKLVKHNELIEKSFKKYDIKINALVDKIYSSLGSYHKTSESDTRSKIRDEFIAYILSNNIYNGKVVFDKNARVQYRVYGEDRILTGPKAANQIFVNKVNAVMQFINDQNIENEDFVQNYFLSSLHVQFNPVTKTKELMFDGGSNLDQEDILKYQSAFIELNRYNVSIDKLNNITVTENTTPREDNDYTDFQKEFLTYGIMNWGLKFGIQNYSYVLPGDLYAEVDQQFNRVLNEFIDGKKGLEKINNIRQQFALQYIINNGNILKPFGISHRRESLGKRNDPQYGEVNVYQGEENGYIYDAKYTNDKNESFPDFIADGFKGKKYIYVRLNGEKDETVYYARVDRISAVKYYHVTNESINKGYEIGDYFNNGYRNFQVGDLNNDPVVFYGKGLVARNLAENIEGSIISKTLYHDITREGKKYYRVIKAENGIYDLEDFTLPSVKKTVSPVSTNIILNPQIPSGTKTIEQLQAEGLVDQTNEDFEPCAAGGLRGNNFTRGSQWSIVKDLKGKPSHAQGGVDLKIGKNGVTFTHNSGVDMHASHGLLIPNLSNNG